MQRAEPALLLEGVDLDHDAVDLVVELDALLLPFLARARDRFDRVVQLRERIRAEAVLPQPLQRVPVPVRRQAVLVSETVNPDRERTARGDRRVLLAKRAGRRVARVRRRLLAFGDQSFVQLVESTEREVDLAAHLEQRRRLLAFPQLHAHRDRLDRPEVRRHVLAAIAVAAGRPADERAVLVDQVDREAVDLRLGDVLDIRRAEAFADVLVPLLERLVRRHLLKRAHRARVLDLLELVRRRRADALRGRVRGDELGVRVLQSCELVVERVVLRVGDLRVVEDVIAVEVVVEDLAQLGGALRRRGGLRGRHTDLRRCRRSRPAPRPRAWGGRGFRPR